MPNADNPVVQAAHHQAARCHQRASECRAKAEDAFDEAAKQDYLDMEHRWLMLARSYELSERITDYTNKVAHRLRAVRPPEQQHVQNAANECGSPISSRARMSGAPPIRPCSLAPVAIRIS